MSARATWPSRTAEERERSLRGMKGAAHALQSSARCSFAHLRRLTWAGTGASWRLATGLWGPRGSPAVGDVDVLQGLADGGLQAQSVPGHIHL